MQTLPTLRLKVDTWARDNTKAGRTTTRSRAAFINMDHTAVARAESGAPVGERFVASVLVAFYPRKFERYFEVVTQR